MDADKFIDSINIVNTRQAMRNLITDITYCMANVTHSTLDEQIIIESNTYLQEAINLINKAEKPFDKWLENEWNKLDGGDE